MATQSTAKEFLNRRILEEKAINLVKLNKWQNILFFHLKNVLSEKNERHTKNKIVFLWIKPLGEAAKIIIFFVPTPSIQFEE